MLGITAVVSELAGGRYLMTRSVMMPMSNPTSTAIGRLRNWAAITAANAAAMSRVSVPGSRPMMGAASTPVSPGRVTLTAHTPTDTETGLAPDSEVMAG